MKGRSPLFRFLVRGALAAAMLLAGGTVAWSQPTVFNPDAALRMFDARVESYAALHRRLAPAPAAANAADPLSRLLTGQYLASAIQSERRDARRGDIFTPHVETVFRWLLANSVGERDGDALLADLSGGEIVPRGMHPTVNEPYSMTRVYRVPLDVRLGLPPLPAELDYRIAAHDLLLWDIYAGIVVDFVPDAFTAAAYTEELTRGLCDD